MLKNVTSKKTDVSQSPQKTYYMPCVKPCNAF